MTQLKQITERQRQSLREHDGALVTLSQGINCPEVASRPEFSITLANNFSIQVERNVLLVLLKRAQPRF